MRAHSGGESLYINSISVALQALTVISIGSLADNRKSPPPLPPMLANPSSPSPPPQTPSPLLRIPRRTLRNPISSPPICLPNLALMCPPSDIRQCRLWSERRGDERIFTWVGEVGA